MEKRKLLYDMYRGAMAYIEVKLPNGHISIGSAFHVGEGVFITAKHVVHNNKIISIATTESFYIEDENGLVTIHNDPKKYTSISAKQLSIKSGPFFHPEENIDVAAFITNETEMQTILLGGHLDDWINDSQFIMSDIMIMGYPIVPFAKDPLLIVVKGEINGVIDRRDKTHPHFIISATARGGFSGGVCLTEWGFALGVIVESITMNDEILENGFMAVITVEPIFVCLQHNKIMPESINQSWEGL